MLVDRDGHRGSCMARHWLRTPSEVKRVRDPGIDETSFLSPALEYWTIYVTGLVDLDRKRITDEGNAAPDLRRWCADQDPTWMRAIRVATDLAESYHSGTSRHLDHGSASPTRFMSCALPTAESKRSAGASRTRRSAIAAARPTRSIRSASSCSRDTNVSMRRVMTACCWVCATVTPTTNFSVPGWLRSRCATST